MVRITEAFGSRTRSGKGADSRQPVAERPGSPTVPEPKHFENTLLFLSFRSTQGQCLLRDGSLHPTR
jgi:hypothetical protein